MSSRSVWCRQGFFHRGNRNLDKNQILRRDDCGLKGPAHTSRIAFLEILEDRRENGHPFILRARVFFLQAAVRNHRSTQRESAAELASEIDVEELEPWRFSSTVMIYPENRYTEALQVYKAVKLYENPGSEFYVVSHEDSHVPMNTAVSGIAYQYETVPRGEAILPVNRQSFRYVSAATRDMSVTYSIDTSSLNGNRIAGTALFEDRRTEPVREVQIQFLRISANVYEINQDN